VGSSGTKSIFGSYRVSGQCPPDPIARHSGPHSNREVEIRLEVGVAHKSFVLTSLSTIALIVIRTSGIVLPKPAVPPVSVPVPTVALVVVDTLRADAVSRSDGRKTTRAPNFYSFAQAGIECTNAYAASSWTPPSHAVLFTGTPYFVGNERTVDPDNHTLAEIFRDAGYVTVGVSANPLLRTDNGFAQGFSLYVNVSENMVLQHNPFGAVFEWFRSRNPRAHPQAKEVTRVSRKILGRYGNSPLFLFVNYMDAHDPYLPSHEALSHYPQLTVEDLPLGVLRRPDRSLSQFMKNDADRLTPQQVEKMEALYWACITDWDVGFGHLLDTFQQRENVGPSMIVVTSDHGEVFGEHGGFFTHKNQLLLGELEIPLVVGGTIIPTIERGTAFEGYLTHEGVHQLFVRINDLAEGQSIGELLSEVALSPGPEAELAIVSAMGPTEVLRGLEDHRGEYANMGIILTYFPRNGSEILFPESGEPRWRSGANEGIAGRVLMDSASALADAYRNGSPIFHGHNYQSDSQNTKDALRSLGYIE